MGKVFISYSHDSEEHTQRVLALSNRLVQDGIDCILDQYESLPPEGWPKWMARQLRESELILIICTKNYSNRLLDESVVKGKGVRWETTLPINYIYYDDEKNRRFIPVVFKNDDIKYIPDILKGTTSYVLDSEKEYELLYRRLTGQPLFHRPSKGDKLIRPLLFEDTTPVRVSISKLPTTMAARLFGRESELELLKKSWENPHTHIVTLVAWAGIGKTTLVNHWVNHMAKNNFFDAKRVYAWSFYSQGAAEGKQASADQFMDEILSWFGDPEPMRGSAVDKGRRLAELIRQEKTLLILDGMEPLQYPPGQKHGLEGKIKDPGLKALVKELASQMDGLCIITTREKVTDLEDYLGYTVTESILQDLPLPAGVALLKNLGVKGRMSELENAVHEYGGHPLALNLLGRYISKVFQGDIRKRDRIPQLSAAPHLGGHALRVMDAYRSWLGNSVELDILHMMGLFDRPVPMAAMEMLKSEPVIHGLTNRIARLSLVEWNFALSHLKELNLLIISNKSPDEDEVLDSHPLVREYFGERYKEKNLQGWFKAHTQLYYYYKNLPQKFYPDTLEEMEPLFAAIGHGCLAGRHQEVVGEVFWARVRREDEAYTTKKLGAFGADLSALAHFFDRPWHKPAAGLTEKYKAAVLNWAAFGLRAMGRLHEAVEPMRTGLEMEVNTENWQNAARSAGNLSELMLTLGQIPEALDYARRSVDHTDKNDEWWLKMMMRTVLADTLHQSGRLDEAAAIFHESEELQRLTQPTYPYLYSMAGFRYCEFLISVRRYTEVIERAEKTLKWALQGNKSILDIALNYLALGWAWLQKISEENKNRFTETTEFLNRAVEGLRKSGSQYHLPRGLLIRAALYRIRQDFEKAQVDLNEAEEIIGSGGMKLFLVDYHIEAGRLILARDGNTADAKHHFNIARTLIEETGYLKRSREVDNALHNI